MNTPIDWAKVAASTGFPDERSMWVEMYETKRQSIPDLAESYNVSKTAIRDALLRNGIKLRGRGGPPIDAPIPGPDDLEEQVARDGVHAVARRLEITVVAVYKRMARRRKLGVTAPRASKSPGS